LATLAVDYYFVPPSHRFTLNIATIPYLGSFALVALIVTVLSNARRQAEESLRQAHGEMEAKVLDRTADLKQVNEKLQAEIAERRRIEEALRVRANLVDLTHDTVFVRDMCDVITYWNRGAEEQYGWPSEEAVGRVSHDLLRTAFPIPLREITEELTRTGRWQGELVHTRRDGTKVVVASRWALQWEGGNPIAVLETNNDITKRKRAEEALRVQASLLNLTHDTVFVRDMNDAITYWNRGAEELYGWKEEEAIGQVSHQFTQTIFPAPLEEINEELLRTGRWEGELTHTKRDGTQVVVASRWSLQRDEQERPAAILETNNDITERKRAEESLRESERRYRHIFQTAGVSIWEEDFSQVKAAIDDLKAQGVRNFRQYLAGHPEFVREATSMVKILDVNNVTVKLFGARSKDELLVSLHKVFLPETQEVFARELIAIAEGRTSFESETVLQTLKGDKLAVLLTITLPPQPATIDSMLVSITDITERKRAEEALNKAQTELAHITRVMTMGELAASIAHEINQPLTAVVTNGNACMRWLTRSQPDLKEAREAVQRIIRDGKRASEVIAGIRALLKRTATNRLPLDINEVIQETVALAQNEARRRRVSLRTDFAANLPSVPGDRVQLQQVILNLMMNGIEAMSSVSDRSRQLLIKTQRDDSGQALISVTDSGIGLDPKQAERLFEAFFTTKTEGMGMGLSISRSIIEAHGGRLWATPNAGSGATFQFAVPMSPDVEA
jgi:PAS domain S-box-containing protein